MEILNITLYVAGSGTASSGAGSGATGVDFAPLLLLDLRFSVGEVQTGQNVQRWPSWLQQDRQGIQKQLSGSSQEQLRIQRQSPWP